MADTKKNSAGEQQPVDDNSRYAKMSASEMSSELAYEIDLSDEFIPRSVGAKYRNYDIRMPDGSFAHFVEGTKLRNKQVFAGRGVKTPFRGAEDVAAVFGGEPKDWQKVKGEATLEQNGKPFDGEIHWCENPILGMKTDFKFKRYI